MADLWLPNAERHIYPNKTGGTYDRLTPKKLCLHTTEGSTIAGALNSYGPYPPHIIASYEERRVVQHIPLNKRSFSLAASEAEDEPVIQVEMSGFAAQTRNWTDDKVDWFTDNVFYPIYLLWPYELRAPAAGFRDTKNSGGAVLASKSSAIRFSMQDFERYGGIFGHQHSPSPDSHWDPGAFRIDRVIARMKAKLGQPHTVIVTPPKKEEPIMAVTPENKNIIKSWYPLHFGRTATEEEAEYWGGLLKNGWTTVLNALSGSAEGMLTRANREKTVYDKVNDISARLDRIEGSLVELTAAMKARPVVTGSVELPPTITYELKK